MSHTARSLPLADLSEPTLRSCLAGVAARDQSAMSQLYDLTVCGVHAVALRILGDAALADDVVADLYLRVWRDAGTRERATGEVMGWLLGMCRDSALAALNRDGEIANSAVSACPDLMSAIDPLSDMHARLELLSPLQCRLVALAFFRGLDQAAIAAHAGIPFAQAGSELADAASRMSQPPSLESTIITPQLYARPSRPSDYQAEARAMEGLSEELGKPCGRILGRLVEAALELCHAHSAGISILENSDAGIAFRWNAVVGEFAPHQGGSLPRYESPCGIVLDRNAPQLMTYPDRYFTHLRGASPRVVEALLVPFHMLGEPVGTVWVLSHHEGTHFCAEDCRLVTALARFAAAAYVLRSSQHTALEARDELIRTNERLRRANERMHDQAAQGLRVDRHDSPANSA